jgi:hypothetical protein
MNKLVYGPHDDLHANAGFEYSMKGTVTVDLSDSAGNFTGKKQ